MNYDLAEEGKDSTRMVQVTEKEVVLQLLMRAFAQHYSPEVISTLRLEFAHHVDAVGIAMKIAIQEPAELLDEQNKDVSFSYPASWWQYFKRDIMPTWFTRRYPVVDTTEVRTVTFKRYAVYPKLPVAMPKYGGEIRMRSVVNVSAYDV